MENWAAESYNLTAVPLEERHTAANIAKWPEAAKLDIPPEKIKAVKCKCFGFFSRKARTGMGKTCRSQSSYLKAAARRLVERFK